MLRLEKVHGCGTLAMAKAFMGHQKDCHVILFLIFDFLQFQLSVTFFGMEGRGEGERDSQIHFWTHSPLL